MVTLAVIALVVAAIVDVLTTPAFAIVGGAPDTGPLSRSAVMVLNSKGGVCSAVMVAPDALLTAAHCVTGASDYRVHFKGDDEQPVLIEPAALAVHPGYDKGAIAGRRRSIDLALVRVGSSRLLDRFSPALLSTAAPEAGETVTVGGYGLSKSGEARSTGTFRSVLLPVIEPYGRSSILLWARGGPRQGACPGDSGGPIADGAAVVAVSTWASGGGREGCGDISQGVLVGPQRAWIDGILAGWGRQAAWR